MKKRLVGLFLVLTMALTLVACGSDKNKDGAKGITPEEYNSQIAKDAETYKKHVTLGNYKGIEVQVDRSTLEVDDSKVKAYIDEKVLPNYKTSEEVKTGTTADGDTIKLDYSGLLDGVAFANGTATDAEYTVGSGKFISDLDKGLAGLEVGKETDIPCRFPDNYENTAMAGKDVVFRVTVTALTKYTYPEYNDEFVQKIAADLETDATNTAQFNEFIKKSLTESAKNTFDGAKYNLVMKAIVENTKIESYPEDEVNTLVETITGNVKAEFETNGASYGITDYASYIKQVYGFETEDAMKESAVEYAHGYLEEKMILTLVCSNEGIKISADEIKEMGNELAEYYGYSSYDDIINEFGNEMNLEVGYSVLSEKAIEFLLNSAVEK